MIRLAWFCGLLLLVCSLAGCGNSTAEVKGKVSVGKKPLTGGTIQFVLVSDPSIAAGGQIKADGTYEVLNAPVGECKVVVDNNFLNPRRKSNVPMAPGAAARMAQGPSAGAKKKMADSPKGVTAPPGEASASEMKYVRIDSKYASKDSTTLTATVTSGGNADVNFDLK